MKRFIFGRKEPRAWFSLVFLTGVLLFISPQGAVAQTLDWSPKDMNFGRVPVGTTATLKLTLTNTDPIIPLRVGSAEITFDDRGAYAVTPSVPLPAFVLPGESFDIDISFSPPDFSFYSSEIIIISNAVNKPMLYYFPLGQGDVMAYICVPPTTNCDDVCVDLSMDLNNCGSCGNVCVAPANAQATCESAVCGFVCDEGYEPVGTGCKAIVPQTPLQMMEDLLEFTYVSMANETLLGFGPGGGGEQSASVRLRVFNKELNKAYLGLRDGNPGACETLNWLQLRTDGGWPFVLPPDFVMGEASGEVYERLIEIIDALGNCKLKEAINKPDR
jgi:hypothetical protein